MEQLQARWERWQQNGPAASFYFSRRLFIRSLAILYAIAFLSLWTQIIGLVGQNGLLPIADSMAFIRSGTGIERYFLLPTLVWFNADDNMLHLLSAGGLLLSGLLLLDLFPRLNLTLLWLFYLSLVTAGQEFTTSQWDYLLLEAGFLAIFLAPPGLHPQGDDQRHPSTAILWLFRWLIFRLIFFSGLVKGLSGDETWRALSALTHYFETQPLPTPLAWYFHQMPLWFHQLSAGLLLIIELLLPFLIFAPRKYRHASALTLSSYQFLIILTGNFAIYNWLTIALCLLLLDDAFWRRWFTSAAPRVQKSRPQTAIGRRLNLLGKGMLVSLILLSGITHSLQLLQRPAPRIALHLTSLTEPFHLVNQYTLFAFVRTYRPEIVIEGSSDGLNWETYHFKAKVSDPGVRPTFLAPHHQRLDWQMWHAVLGNYQQNRWISNLQLGLLENNATTLSLFKENPFPNEPPHYIRTPVFIYRYTTAEEKAATGDWWVAEYAGDYMPGISR